MPSYEKAISPATLETSSVYIYIPDEKLKNLWRPAAHYHGAVDGIFFIQTDGKQANDFVFVLTSLLHLASCKLLKVCASCRKRRIRILVLTQSLADLDMIYGKDERKAMLSNFKFTVLLGCKDAETQEYFSKMIGEKRSLLATDPNQKPQPIIKPADLAHLEQDLFVICDDGAIRLRKKFSTSNST